MTSSASKKRRRRREREKRQQELLQRARAISLVDVASPPPANGSRSREETRQDFSEPVSKGLIRSQTSTMNGFHEVDKQTSSSINPPQEPSWKRVDFVFPRADGKKPFVFDRQKAQEESLKPFLLQPDNDETDEKLKEYRKFESIDDILFAGKRKKESVPTKNDDGSPAEEAASKKTTTQQDKNEDIISESQRKKLEGAFEAAQQPENSMAIGNFIDVPKTSEQNGGKTTSSPDHTPKSALKTENPVGGSDENNGQRKRSNSVTISSPGQISGRTVKEAVRDKRGLRPRANSTDGELNLPRGGLCDERMILEAHKWIGGKKFINQNPPRGLHNLGNTCFLNATLQCLAYLPPLCQALITLSNSKIGRDQNGGKKKIPQGQKITSSLCNVFQQAHGLSNGSKAGGPFAPKKVVGHLSNIGTCGSRNGYKFRLGRQEDAHEFLVHLLDAINDGELRAAGINQNVSGWRDRLPVSRLDETTFVHRIFGGYFRSQIRCRRCNYKSNTYDPFLDLSLEVSKKSSTSVLRALSEFTRKETLDAANQWKCSGCKKYVCATKQLTVFRPPLTLCIQLKRFAFDMFGFGHKFSKYHHGGYGGSGGGSKITKPIEFPGTLNLPLSDNRSCQYTLTGVVIHVGGSSQSGHYTAYVKKPGKNGTNQWYHLDDSYVQPVSEKTVLKQKDAYLLFYCRTEVKLEFPDPPSRSMSASEATEFGRTRALARAKSLPSESMKKDLIAQGVGQFSKENAMNGNSNKKMSVHAQENGHASSKKDRKETLQRVKTTIHPLADAKSLSKAAYTTREKESEESDTSSASSSPGRRSTPAESRMAGIEKRNTYASDSSGDSSYNQTSVASESSAGGESSSEIDSPPESPKTNQTPQKYEEGDSSDSEMETVAGSSVSNIKKSVNSDDESQDSSSDSSNSSEDNDDAIEDSSAKKNLVQDLGKKYIGGPNESPKQRNNSSESETDVSDSESDDESSSAEEKTPKVDNKTKNVFNSEKKSANTVVPKKPQVVQNNTDSRGKVKVMLGSRKRKTWESVTTALPSKGSNFHLLGNRKVSQWDDDDDDENGDVMNNKKGAKSTIRKRENIVDSIDKQNRSRKRKMHLDRWDSHLDQGRMKKVKSKVDANPHETSSKAPKKNIFQRIQSGVQKMSRGKPKGIGFRRKFKRRKGSF